jgi:secondary thiamine-phosphate synthase enzyme
MDIETNETNQIIDVTFEVESEVEKEVKKRKIKEGICIVSIPHVSAGLILAENEPGILKDYINILNKLVPAGNYQHNLKDTNAESQLKSMLLGSNQTILIEKGKITLGRWQSILFVELDGPRKRHINIKVIKNDISP